ncbi:SGNH/GDSL hydrolase family protein [Candidatus Electronema sp. PJ]|uniref:SGNH/GDSL hydrolase family protein n=1 Tax=Candidatus Electronema sp. PJ TaxID=3401572 RepID=UPI003AA80473
MTIRMTTRKLIIALCGVLVLQGAICRAATVDSRKIVAFGDSITAGYPYLKVGKGCTNCGGYELFLQYYLDWEGKGRKVYNYGVSGEYVVFQGINRIDSVMAATRPKHVLLMEGTNDLSLYIDPATVAYNIYVVAYKVLLWGGKPIVGTITPDTRYGQDWKRVGKTNSYIKSYVKATPQMCLSDQNSAIAPYWNSGYNYEKLHPNYYGYWIMGLNWYYALYYCK